MNKRKLIRKMAFPAAIVFIAAIAIMLSSIPYRSASNKNRTEALNAHLTALTQESQQFLDEAAKKIGAVADTLRDDKILPLTRAVREIQSQMLLEHQKIDNVKRYLWMTNPPGEFLFGSPAAVFARLNDGFERYREVLTSTDAYRNRNDFLINLVEKHERIDFTKLDINALPDLQKNPWVNSDAWRYTRPRTLILSAPVLNNSGNVEGTLFLKIDDSINEELYYTNRMAENRDMYENALFPIFGVIAFFTGMFLWFLLPTWVYIDAQQRDLSNPGLWAFITLISMVFGLAIYLITRPANMKSLHCPKCENDLNGAGAFCPHCGFDLSSPYCQQCQYPIKKDWAFCPNCRSDIQGEKVVAAARESIKAAPEKAEET